MLATLDLSRATKQPHCFSVVAHHRLLTAGCVIGTSIPVTIDVVRKSLIVLELSLQRHLLQRLLRLLAFLCCVCLCGCVLILLLLLLLLRLLLFWTALHLC